MDTQLLDLIARTRPTILEILKDRGYNVTEYENRSAEELQKLAIASPHLLRIRAEKIEDGPAPMSRCNVIYWIENAVRLKIDNEVQSLFAEENENRMIPAEDEVVVILQEPFNEAFHVHAIKIWNSMKARVSFFHIKHLVSNPRKHSMVPLHRKLNEGEIAELMQRRHLRSKGELPRLLFHVDMQARVLGLVPGDVVEIKRGSQTCGETTDARVCSLG